MFFLFIITAIYCLEIATPPVLLPQCSSQNFFDLTLLSCQSCPSNSISASTTCVCNAGYIYSDSTLSACSACSSGQTSSFDRLRCLSCPPNSSLITTSSTNCICSNFQFLRDVDTNGTLLTTAVCESCPSYAYPSSDLSACISCPDIQNMVSVYSNNKYSCQCQTAKGYQSIPQGGQCVMDSGMALVQSNYKNNPFSVNYLDLVSPSGASTSALLQTSDFFSTYLYESMVDCYAYDMIACELLSNLCVLGMYDTSSAACSAYIAIAQTRAFISKTLYDYPKSLPYLYYGLIGHQSAESTASQIPNIKVDISSGSGISSLPFVLAVYNSTGYFLGFQNLTNQFMLCESDYSSKLAWLKVGVNYQIQCSINLNSLIFSNYTNYFYDLFITETTGNLFPVPVRIYNYRLNNAKVNMKSSFDTYSDNQFTRRFFLFDFTSGWQGGKLKYIRIPTSINFWIITGSSSGTIQVPIMDIQYSDRDVSSISSDDASIYSTPLFTFSSAYSMSLTDFWQSIRIVFAVIGVLGGMFALYQSRNWGHRNLGASDSIDVKFLFRTVLFLSGCLGPLAFWFTFAVCAYWFFFYKGQSVLYLVLPIKTADTSVLYLLLVAVVACQALFIAKEMYKQLTMDIFIIDWEKSRGKIVSTHEQNPTSAPVSIWRSIFMANQWSSIQLYRRINIECTLIITVLLLEGFGWRNVACSQPSINAQDAKTINVVLLFAVDTMIWILVMLGLVFEKGTHI